MPVPGGAAGSILGFPVGVVADGGQRLHVTDRGQAVVLGASGVHE